MEKDQALYRRFAEGDNSAFKELVLSHKDNLIYFLKRYLQDVYTCEDIAQDTFAAIFVKKESYDYRVSFKTYLYTIAKNKAIDHIRKFSKIQSLSEISLLSAEETMAQEDALFKRVVKKQEQVLVHQAIQTLKADYQKVLCLIDLEGFSYRDAARVLDKTIPQIKILIFRARGALKKSLVKEGFRYED